MHLHRHEDARACDAAVAPTQGRAPHLIPACCLVRQITSSSTTSSSPNAIAVCHFQGVPLLRGTNLGLPVSGRSNYRGG